MEQVTDMAREWIIDGYDGFEGLRLRDCEIETPNPTEVRLRIEAFALNWGDDDLMRDRYSFSFSAFPARIGMEAAGVVEAVGADVSGINIGDRYCTLPYFYDRRGASADTLIIDQAYITKAPDGLSAVEAASVWMQYMTAYFPIVEQFNAAPGINIFAPAGTSTAGCAALQIGRMEGATMITSTRSADNVDYLRANGADHVFVDDGSDIAAFLLEVTDGVGIHGSFDPVGGGFMARYASALVNGGKLMLYGALTGTYDPPPTLHMFQSDAWFNTYSLFNMVGNAERCAHGKAFVYDALQRGDLRPNVDRTFPMEGYQDAWRYLRGKRTSYGKVVIETGSEAE